MSRLTTLTFDWYCMHTWLQSSKNTLWCLLGCCIGDFGTIGFFQFMEIAWPVSLIMTLAIINGIITSIILETLILSKQMLFKLAFDSIIKNNNENPVSKNLISNINLNNQTPKDNKNGISAPLPKNLNTN